MRFKIKFTQDCQATEVAECIIEADTKEEAIEKMMARDFTSYLVTKRIEEHSNEEVQTVTIVKEY